MRTHGLESDSLRENARCTNLSPTLIEPVPVVINYDLTVEQMMAAYQPFDQLMEECTAPAGYASDYFPSCKEGRTGRQTRELLLFRPVPVGEHWELDRVRAAIDRAGYLAEELPGLIALFPFVDSLWDLWGNRVGFIHAVGPGSVWRPREEDSVYGAFLHPSDGKVHVWEWGSLDRAGGDQDWFVVSHRPSGDK